MKSTDTEKTAGVLVRPPILYLGALVLGLVLDQVLSPAVSLSSAPVMVSGAVFLGLGLLILIIAARRFALAKTPVPTNLPTTHLVTEGLYRFSRNPIYAALTLIYLGLALLFRSWGALLLLPVVLIVMRYGVIAREERYLSERFGESYRAYQQRVRRWL